MAIVSIVSSILGISLIPTFFLLRLHRRLAKVTIHHFHSGVITNSISNEVLSIPATAIQSKCLLVSDTASRSIKTALLPSLDIDEQLTLYLRYTMSRFSRLPQAFIIRFMTPAAGRVTFEQSHISNLDFKEGDVVCGLYEVALRKEGRVEFAMKSPDEKIDGRLVCTVERVGSKGEETVFKTETVMWKDRGASVVMPLERGVPFWAHEVTSWWLLDVGTKYLMESKSIGKDKEEKEL